MGVARIIRGQVLAIRERDYVLAARALGASPLAIVARHVLPNAIPIGIVVMGIDVGSVILTESGLSDLGLGVQPPTPSWGNMLTNAQRYFFSAPWLVFAPGFCIWTTVLVLYLIADGVRDALDPRLRR